MLDLAKREASRRGAGHIAFQSPDACSTSPQQFDLIVCYHVLQRLPKRQAWRCSRAHRADRAERGRRISVASPHRGLDGARRDSMGARARSGGQRGDQPASWQAAADPFIPTHAYTWTTCCPC